jgi:hypothetical protein
VSFVLFVGVILNFIFGHGITSLFILSVVCRSLNLIYNIQPKIQCEPVGRMVGGQNYPFAWDGLSFVKGNDCSISWQVAQGL